MRDAPLHSLANGVAAPSLAWGNDDTWREDPRFREDAAEKKTASKGPLVIIYGDVEPEPPPYLIEGLLPQTQTAILAAQFAGGKTFAAIDITMAVMLGLNVAGHQVVRQGAVLWLASEGHNEVEVRLKAAALHRTGEDQKGKLPFCKQAFTVPRLTQDGAFDDLMAIVSAAQAAFAQRFPGAGLSLVVIDTLNSAAGFADQNDGAEAQRVMDLCRRVSNETGALILLIDHFGKLAETGVKGSQNKSDSADAILTILADRAIDGTITNRRLCVSKLRNGPSGETIPFKLVQVPVNDQGGTSCGLDWEPMSISDRAAAAVQAPKPDWARSGRVLKASMIGAMIENGRMQRPFGFEAAAVKAVEHQCVRSEFYARYPAENHEAKKKQFAREVKAALDKGLIASREIDGVDWLWFLKDADALEASGSKIDGVPWGGGQGGQRDSIL